MSIFQGIKKWLGAPLTPNVDPVNLVLYVGIIFIAAWLWASVIGGIVRVTSAAKEVVV